MQFRWVGHAMPDTRLPKCIFYGQLPGGGRSHGGPATALRGRAET